MNNSRIRAIEENEFGLYVWLDTEGKVLADSEFRPLSVPAKKGDPVKIMALRDAAHRFLKESGKEPGGRPQFWSGRRQISDSEWEDQIARQKAGLVPDPYDVAAMKEEAEYAKRRNN